MDNKFTKNFQQKLLAWYRKNARHDLPWRKTRDPYAIWISEAMLQQTQVKKVIPHYRKFLKRFPTVRALGKTPLTDVVDAWSGLGYYSRAKNLHAAAGKVCREYGGSLPETAVELLKLPGIGRYTAGAIASIAFDRPEPILDGNVIRVLCRVFCIRQDPRQPAIQRKLWRLSSQLVPKESPGIFNQALMELGALRCTPRSPECPGCPLNSLCLARQRGLQGKVPPARVSASRKKISYLCGILEKNGKVLVARRPLEGLLPGLWEFPGGEKEPRESDEAALRRILQSRGVKVEAVRPLVTCEQTLTHRQIRIRAFLCQWRGLRLKSIGYPETRWVSRGKLLKVPWTAGMRQVAEKLSSLEVRRGS